MPSYAHRRSHACLPLPLPGYTTLRAVLQVRGEIHHDRRLHQLMLQEEINQVGVGGRADEREVSEE